MKRGFKIGWVIVGLWACQSSSSEPLPDDVTYVGCLCDGEPAGNVVLIEEDSELTLWFGQDAAGNAVGTLVFDGELEIYGQTLIDDGFFVCRCSSTYRRVSPVSTMSSTRITGRPLMSVVTSRRISIDSSRSSP